MSTQLKQDNKQDNRQQEGWQQQGGKLPWAWLLIPFALLVLQWAWLGQPSDVLPYSDFKQLLHAGKLEEVVVGENRIHGTLRDDGLEAVLPKQRLEQLKRDNEGRRAFSTVPVADPSLASELEAAHVRFEGEQKGSGPSEIWTWLFPIILYLIFWRLLMGGSGGIGRFALDIGKSRAHVHEISKSDVRFDDVAGIDEAKQELMEIVEFLKNPERYRRLGGKIPKGVLIVGAPGTGKTLLAKAVAGEAGVPFFSISGSEFVEMFVGVGAARVRDLFAQAQEKAPCIIFIDELDALGRARGLGVTTGHDEQGQTLNQLLVEMDGFDTNKGVIILAATNRPEILDPALLRPGRFDRHIAIDRPDFKGRQKILEVHARNVKLAPGVDLNVIAARTAGFVGADLANVVNEAALLAARLDKEQVEMSDFDEAIDRIVAGLQRKTRVMNAIEKKTVAYHESGHALVAECRVHADRVNKISIIPRGIAALGYTQQLPAEDRYLVKRSELFDRLDVLLGGRVAEELVFGEASTGAQNDLQLATDMARHMVAQYGMSERLGLITVEQARAPLLDTRLPQERKAYSEHTAQLIDEEVSRLLAQAHERVRETLAGKRALLDALAALLLEKESIGRAELDELLKAQMREGQGRRAEVPVPVHESG